MSKKFVWYFAYGNNMNSSVLKQRGVEPIKSIVAKVPNMRIAFEMISFYRPGTGDATIRTFIKQEKQNIPEVWGVLHWLPTSALDNYLDCWEAVDLGHYQRKEIKAVTKHNRVVSAIAYEALVLNSALLPSKQYLEAITAGAKQFGLPSDYQSFLKAHPTCKA